MAHKVCTPLPPPTDSFRSLIALDIFIAVLAKIAQGEISGDDVVGAVLAIAQAAEENMGGTSGALYSYVYLPHQKFRRPP
jgi:hypothetical protein